MVAAETVADGCERCAKCDECGQEYSVCIAPTDTSTEATMKFECDCGRWNDVDIEPFGETRTVVCSLCGLQYDFTVTQYAGARSALPARPSPLATCTVDEWIDAKARAAEPLPDADTIARAFAVVAHADAAERARIAPFLELRPLVIVEDRTLAERIEDGDAPGVRVVVGVRPCEGCLMESLSNDERTGPHTCGRSQR
jgi:hypothetical protein